MTGSGFIRSFPSLPCHWTQLHQSPGQVFILYRESEHLSLGLWAAAWGYFLLLHWKAKEGLRKLWELISHLWAAGSRMQAWSVPLIVWERNKNIGMYEPQLPWWSSDFHALLIIPELQTASPWLCGLNLVLAYSLLLHYMQLQQTERNEWKKVVELIHQNQLSKMSLGADLEEAAKMSTGLEHLLWRGQPGAEKALGRSL